jgi:trehalose-6-phosphatase
VKLADDERPMYVAIDFDGTIVEHRYPDIGAPVPGAIGWIKELQAAGAKLILWTMRSDTPESGPTLTQAVEYCRVNGIEFFGVNGNPTQATWTSSAKAYAHVYVDDAAFGCPLRESVRVGGRPCVDWHVVGPRLLEMVKGSR